MTVNFAPPPRRPPPAPVTADIVIEAPPGCPPPGSLLRMVPVVMSVATSGIMAAAFFSGSAVTRNPTFLMLPLMMLASAALTAVTGRGRRGGVDADRADYLEYLGRLRATVAEIALAQCAALERSHPDPESLWTLIGGPRMWEARAADPDFCVVRVGVGARPLAARLVAPEEGYASDPVTAMAVRRFVETHSIVTDVPIAIDVRGCHTVTIGGDVIAVRGLLRAMICRLAVLHAPDQLLIAGAVSDDNLVHWDWLKWLPHNQHPHRVDALGAARMVYCDAAEAVAALAAVEAPHAVLIADLDRPSKLDETANLTLLEVGAGHDGTPVTIDRGGDAQTLVRPDRLDLLDTLVCARRLAAYRVDAAAPGRGSRSWPVLAGLGDVTRFDAAMLWRGRGGRDRLRIPIGTTADGAPLDLDIKEAAEGGVGPHGVCVGATGSGKSELLRTIALGMMARNSPRALNLLLIDFKGGATFLDMARSPHVGAVITNLSEEAPLVARMRDALAGEMNRRQQLLRAAGCGSIAAYRAARRGRLPYLPALFIIADEFSELLHQHPDFADMFVAIGRLGRSLGMHLLLASQRVDEGRLRGLETHLSYRICLKTTSAAESRTVLGTPDAYHLPSTPGAGYLRAGSDEPIRFHAAFVSGPLPADPRPAAPVAAARAFTARAAGSVTAATETGGPGTPTVLHAVLDRLAGHGPPAHRVWLPPLGPSPALDTLLPDTAPTRPVLTVPIGIVDRPFEQRRTQLAVELAGAAGNVAIVGAPQSGKSTALRTLITALAATHGPGWVQFYCLDFGGGMLASVRGLPHVGAVAGRTEPRLAERIVAECESVVRTREAIFTDQGIDSIDRYRRLRADQAAPADDVFGDVFLVVDGWATVRQEFEALDASITALASRGLSFGVHVVLSASRWADIRPSLRDQIGTRIELRLGDPAESELDRRAARQVPPDRPGRGITGDGLHMVIALPTGNVLHGPAAPPIPLLPTHIDRDAVVQQAGVELCARPLIGLEERRLQPVAVDFEQHPHLLILGDNACGKTATLRTLLREILRTRSAAQPRLLMIDFRRSLLGVVESECLDGYVVSPPALRTMLPDLLQLLQRRMPPSDVSPAQLRERSWWTGPDLYILVDDYDLLEGLSGNPLVAIAEYLPYARDLGLHLAVTRRSAGVERAVFEPLLAGLRELGCAELRMSGCPGEGSPLGSARPARLPPGRGFLITRPGDERLIQVAWSPP